MADQSKKLYSSRRWLSGDLSNTASASALVRLEDCDPDPYLDCDFRICDGDNNLYFGTFDPVSGKNLDAHVQALTILKTEIEDYLVAIEHARAIPPPPASAHQRRTAQRVDHP